MSGLADDNTPVFGYDVHARNPNGGEAKRFGVETFVEVAHHVAELCGDYDRIEVTHLDLSGKETLVLQYSREGFVQP